VTSGRLRAAIALAAVLTCALTASLAASLVAAPAAFAESPWWHLTSGTRPAYLYAGAGKAGVDEQQAVTVKATGGRFVLANMTKQEVEEGKYFCVNGTEETPKFAEYEYNASASEVQAGLEQVCGYGAGSVEVSGGPGDAGGTSPYSITFKGPLAERQVPLVNTEIGGEPTPLEGTVEATISRDARPASPDGEIYVTAENLGDADVEGGKATVQLRDVLPKGLKATEVAGTKPFSGGDFQARSPIPCSLSEKAGSQVATCTLTQDLAPYDQIEMRIAVDVQPGAESSEQVNEAAITGGGAPSAPPLRRAVKVSSEPVPYGVEDYEMALEEDGGELATQAGAHPFQLTATLALNQLADTNPLADESAEFRPEVTAPAMAKDLSFQLPAGLVGNATAIPQCTTQQFFETVEGQENRCPPDSAIGVATTLVHEPATVGTAILTEPVFNLEPREGEPARFGFYVVIANSPVFIDASVRNGADYGVVAHVDNITQTAEPLLSEVTLWGVPEDSRHDRQRGWGCLYEARGARSSQPCVPAAERNPKPFLSLPTSCNRTLGTKVEGNSWEAPSSFFEVTGAFEPATPLRGCNRLPFGPQVAVTPDGQQASRPTGVSFDVHVPQEADENAQGAASSNIRALTVTLPPGVSVNPSAADGLQACSEQQVGYLNERGALEEMLFSSTLPEPFCPDAAKIGTASIKTPLLAQPLQGGVYLATPAPNGEAGKNPFNSLVALYIVLQDPASGVLVKLPVQVSLDQSTGQATATLQNTPDLDFEDAEVDLFDGPRAPLASPDHCDAYPVKAEFTPWSGTVTVTSTATFQVTSGAGGAPCPPASLPFAPSLAAGTIGSNAGAFSPLSTSINREDGDQQLGAVSLGLPPGLSGVLAGVTLCPEASANAGTCPQNSLIGHSTVAAGFGPDPFTVEGGQVFLTESYEGAPFGLSILTPAVAGPFNLGDVVVRAKVQVDPQTAALTVTTNETGPYAIPHILDGIPLDLRHLNVTIDRPGFVFNPTNCNPLSIGGTITAVEGASAAVSSPFRATACNQLKFAPRFSVSVSGRSSKANGTSFTVKLAYPPGPIGTYANLARAKVSLPKQLPSRLSTLNKACVVATFDANPAACPKASVVGHAKVLTPLLPVPLEGPAYFVSHAAEAFPDLTIVLKGYGITIDLVGNTQIKKGITTSTFKATPDVPFSSFELSLPAQSNSALTTNVNICKPSTKLSMPTEFVAQSGAEIKQSTPVSITGCGKPLTRAQKLAKALKACRRKHEKRKRRACEVQARAPKRK
jgi:hypothetical protein